ncbi:MAG: LacI family transcriptional regulator [Puniceicoccaceae bacterium 5H]|nr:MAG: LacI family transcriptional regulator [Puniceicoccaceae bacterium 5H]
MPSRKKIALIVETRLEENVRVLNGMAAYLRFEGKWSAFIDDRAEAVHRPEWLFREHWDGIIVRHSCTRIIEECLQRGIPCVDLSDDTRTVSGVPKVRPDNVAIGHVGAEHLMERGHKHFAYCGFSSESWSLERRQGFTESLKLAGFEPVVFESAYDVETEPHWDIEEEQRISEWLAPLPRPIAIMACNDLRALQVVKACRLLNIEVPEEISVLGVNNETIRCEMAHPALSSVPVNALAYGKTAAATLDALMAGEPIPAAEQLIEPTEVVARRSTDALAIEDPVIAKALNFIRERATSGITVEEVVKQSHISRSLLERRFRKYLARSPQMEIRHVQVQRIKQMLAETDYPLATIAELAGFEHPEYMSVVFKRITHLTPGQFRRKVQQKS